MPNLRGLDQVLADFDTRQRQAPGSRNRPIQKFASVFDQVTASDAGWPVTSLVTPPFLWASSTGIPPQGSDLAWAMGEWS